MVQMRLMHDDPERVREVVELVLPLLRASGVVMVGDETELPNRRGPGLRVIAEVIPAPRSARVTAECGEPADSPVAPPGRPVTGGPIALGPGTS